MANMFEMSDMGLLSMYLGIEVCQIDEFISLSHKLFALKILKTFDMMNCNSSITPLEVRRIFNQKEGRNLVNATTYKSLMGSLRYLTHTRPDLSFNVGFMENSSTEHLKCPKHILRYIEGTLNFGLNDYGGDTEERKSTSGFCFFIGNSPVTWVSQKQIIVTLLSCEAKYISLTLVACQGVWLVEFLEELTKSTSNQLRYKLIMSLPLSS
ncbi:unnamed protein product [Spirodela intermedia]|uniref:Reverse transcriptase Ty1/copia-type domain-containing protein n=1 Tax=Spirodela intermedia TaxID=51605 RepID=A0A7I8KNH6_SPIIN|nr:unnamed protein product [Spirodela intermedia]